MNRPIDRLRIGIGLALALAGCSALPTPVPTAPTPTPVPSLRALGPGELWLPVFLTMTADGVPIACAGTGFAQVVQLHGSATDPRLTWMTWADGTRRELVWPPGYSARFNPGLEVLDEAGNVVGREGAILSGGCPMPPGDGMWVEFASPRPSAMPQ
jgi:hypothetical protein